MSAERRPLELVRGLGPWAAAAIVIGTMIGGGIFIVPAQMAQMAGTPFLVYAVWVGGGILTLFGTFAYSELGAAIPEAGGEYPYISRGFGRMWGFLFGWMHSMVGRPSSIATIAAEVLLFWGFLDPRVLQPLATISIPLPWSSTPHPFVFTMAMPLAVVVIVLVTFVNYLGVKLGGQVQVALTVVKLAAVAAVILAGFAFVAHPAAVQQAAEHAGTVSGLFAALVAALWAYDGWNNLNLVGSEVKEPSRNIPRALVGGVSVVMILYILTTLVCFLALPFAQVAASQHVVSDVMSRIAGAGVATWLTVAMLISALGTLNSSILTGARVDYAMARDKRFFSIAGGIHPRFRTPASALIFQCVLASILALTGAFYALASLYIFVQFIFYAMAVAAVIRLRRIEPNLSRPYRTWGYPVFPLLFIFGAIAVSVSVLIAQPLRSGLGLVVILIGFFFYRFWEGKQA